MEKSHTKDTVWCCAYFCRKISLVLLILFPPWQGLPDGALRRPCSFLGERRRKGKIENALHRHSRPLEDTQVIGLEDRCVSQSEPSGQALFSCQNEF